MVRNKSQGQQGLNDNRLENQDDNKQNKKAPNSGALAQDEQRETLVRKNGKGLNTRKGSPGKNNH